MKTTISATHLIAAAVIGGSFTLGFLSGPAFAEPEVRAPFEFQFRYEQKELATEAGAQRLLVRLERSVTRHCTDDARGKFRSTETQKVQACINETMSQTVSGMGSSTVAQAYKSRADG